MADMDTYADEPRQYEGTYRISTREESRYRFGYQNTSELASTAYKHHNIRYPGVTQHADIQLITCEQTSETTLQHATALVLPWQTVMAMSGYATSP